MVPYLACFWALRYLHKWRVRATEDPSNLSTVTTGLNFPSAVPCSPRHASRLPDARPPFLAEDSRSTQPSDSQPPAQPELADLRVKSGSMLHKALIKRLEDAQAVGEIGETVDIERAARFVETTMLGLQVAAKAGESALRLRRLASLRAARLEGSIRRLTARLLARRIVSGRRWCLRQRRRSRPPLVLHPSFRSKGIRFFIPTLQLHLLRLVTRECTHSMRWHRLSLPSVK